MEIRKDSNIYLEKSANKFSPLLLLLSFVFCISCVPQPNSINKASGSSNNISTPNSSPSGNEYSATITEDESPLGEPISELYWYSNKEIANDTITINSNMSSVIYLRGSAVETFLSKSDMNKSYCLIASYNAEFAKKQLRLRAIGINFNNLTLGRVEKLLRVDVPDAKSNQDFCSGSVEETSDLNQISFEAKELCPSCLQILNSTSVKLFNSSSGKVTTQVAKEIFNIDSTSIRVDPKNEIISNTNICSDSTCSAKGYDCCLNGQCANDGAKDLAHLNTLSTSSLESIFCPIH